VKITEDLVHGACKLYERTQRVTPLYLIIHPFDWLVVREGLLKHCLDENDHVRIGRFRLKPYMLDTCPMGHILIGHRIDVRPNTVPFKRRHLSAKVHVVRGGTGE
jgi:hypothetical protein